MLKMPTIIIGIFVALFSHFGLVLAESKVTSNWHETDYSRARAHILSTSGSVIHLAVEISIVENYKTYWKAPGSTGVPPIVSISGINIVDDSTKISFPFPHKYINKYGETWGYKDSAVLFVDLKRHDVQQKSKLNFTLDYAVCDEICLPEHAEFKLSLDENELAPTMASLKFAKYSRQISKAVKAQQSVIAAVQLNDKNQLQIALKSPLVGDVFITDSANRFYQHLSTDADKQVFSIHGMAIDDAFRNQLFEIHYFTGEQYQFVKLPLNQVM